MEDFSLALLEDDQELGSLYGFRGKRPATRDSGCGIWGFSLATTAASLRSASINYRDRFAIHYRHDAPSVRRFQFLFQFRMPTDSGVGSRTQARKTPNIFWNEPLKSTLKRSFLMPSRWFAE